MTPEQQQRRKEEIERLRSKARALAGTLPDPFDFYDKENKFVCKKDDVRKLTLYEFLRKDVAMGYCQQLKLWSKWEQILHWLDQKDFVDFVEIPAGSGKYFFNLNARYEANKEKIKKQKAKAEEESENGIYE